MATLTYEKPAQQAVNPPLVGKDCRNCNQPANNYCNPCQQYYCHCDWIVAIHACH